jgi:hypothetical protein
MQVAVAVPGREHRELDVLDQRPELVARWARLVHVVDFRKQAEAAGPMDCST